MVRRWKKWLVRGRQKDTKWTYDLSALTTEELKRLVEDLWARPYCKNKPTRIEEETP